MQLGAVLSLLTCLGLLGGWLWLLWSRRQTRDDATEAADGEASRPAESNGESNGEAGGSAGDELPTTTARASSDGDSSKPVG